MVKCERGWKRRVSVFLGAEKPRRRLRLRGQTRRPLSRDPLLKSRFCGFAFLPIPAARAVPFFPTEPPSGARRARGRGEVGKSNSAASMKIRRQERPTAPRLCISSRRTLGRLSLYDSRCFFFIFVRSKCAHIRINVVATVSSSFRTFRCPFSQKGRMFECFAELFLRAPFRTIDRCSPGNIPTSSPAFPAKINVCFRKTRAGDRNIAGDALKGRRRAGACDPFIPTVYTSPEHATECRRDAGRASIIACDRSFMRPVSVRDICHQSRSQPARRFRRCIALISTCRCGCNFASAAISRSNGSIRPR